MSSTSSTGPVGTRAAHLEGTVDVAQLLGAVLHLLLRPAARDGAGRHSRNASVQPSASRDGEARRPDPATWSTARTSPTPAAGRAPMPLTSRTAAVDQLVGVAVVVVLALLDQRLPSRRRRRRSSARPGSQPQLGAGSVPRASSSPAGHCSPRLDLEHAPPRRYGAASATTPASSSARELPPRAVVAAAARLGGRVVELPPQERHAALRGRRRSRPSPPAPPGAARSPARPAPRRRSTAAASAATRRPHPLDGALDLEHLEHRLDAAAADVDLALDRRRSSPARPRSSSSATTCSACSLGGKAVRMK